MQSSRGESGACLDELKEIQYGCMGEVQDPVRQESLSCAGVQLFSEMMRSYLKVLSRSTIR